MTEKIQQTDRQRDAPMCKGRRRSHLHEGVGVAGSPKVGQPHRSVSISASLLHHLICNTRSWGRGGAVALHSEVMDDS